MHTNPQHGLLLIDFCTGIAPLLKYMWSDHERTEHMETAEETTGSGWCKELAALHADVLQIRAGMMFTWANNEGCVEERHIGKIYRSFAQRR